MKQLLGAFQKGNNDDTNRYVWKMDQINFFAVLKINITFGGKAILLKMKRGHFFPPKPFSLLQYRLSKDKH